MESREFEKFKTGIRVFPQHRETKARNTHTRKKTRPELRNMEIANTGYMIKVFNNLRSKLAEVQNLPEFAMEACEMNMLMWSWFYNSSMKAAIHLSLEHIEYLEMSKNSEFDDIEGFFHVTKNLIADNEEIRNKTFLDWSSPSWTRSTLLNDRATQLTMAKVYVCTDSALCFRQGKQLNSRKAKWQLFKWMENRLN